MRYIVKHMNNGDVGVYDTEHGCFPNVSPELRAVGMVRLDWLRGDGAEAEALRIADALNMLDQGGTMPKSSKVVSAAHMAQDEAAMRESAQALIDSERMARASG